MQISRVLHAGYILEHAGTRIVFDPLFENPFSRNCHAFPAVRFDVGQIPRFDAVFISHYHDDHCSFASLDRIDRATPVYMYCLHEDMFNLLAELGFTRVTPLRLHQSVTVGAFEITPWPALDRDVDALFEIRAGTQSVLNVVDAWIDDDTLARLARRRWDVVLWPFQTLLEYAVLAPGRAQPPERGVDADTLRQLRVLAPRFVVPSSCQFTFEAWSWYRRAFFPISYARFAADVGPEHVTRMDPGDTFTLDERGLTRTGRLPWVEPLEHGVDYVYEEGPPPTTAEIARHLPALTPEERARVDAFCRALTPDRDWCLKVYDHEETRHEFGAGPAWTTEVPAFTLHGALVHGESLTSMYVRIDDGGDHEADLLTDPLLTALFAGKFGSYQMAQLRRIQGRSPSVDLTLDISGTDP